MGVICNASHRAQCMAGCAQLPLDFAPDSGDTAARGSAWQCLGGFLNKALCDGCNPLQKQKLRQFKKGG